MRFSINLRFHQDMLLISEECRIKKKKNLVMRHNQYVILKQFYLTMIYKVSMKSFSDFRILFIKTSLATDLVYFLQILQLRKFFIIYFIHELQHGFHLLPRECLKLRVISCHLLSDISC